MRMFKEMALVRYYRDLQPLKHIIKNHVLNQDFGMKATNDDRVLIITGHTGTGKSYLGLDIFEWYLQEILNLDLDDELFNFFSITDKDWITAISQAKNKPFYPIVHDEAVNILYAKDAISRKNKSVNKLFKQIRGKRIYHIMLIPQVHRLDREFRDDRIGSIINVKKSKGKRVLEYYSRAKCDRLLNELDLMQKNLKDKKERTSIDACQTKPNFICKIPMYKGKFLPLYQPKKDANMDDSIDTTLSAIAEGRGEGKKKDDLDNGTLKKLAYKNHLAGVNNVKIGESLDVSETTVRRWIKQEARRAKVNRRQLKVNEK